MLKKCAAYVPRFQPSLSGQSVQKPAGQRSNRLPLPDTTPLQTVLTPWDCAPLDGGDGRFMQSTGELCFDLPWWNSIAALDLPRTRAAAAGARPQQPPMRASTWRVGDYMSRGKIVKYKSRFHSRGTATTYHLRT